MPSLREAAAQALEALEYYQHRRLEWDYSDEVAITALRVALAEPDLFHCPKCGGPADNGHDRSIPPSPYWCTKCMAEPVQEPVAWMYRGIKNDGSEHGPHLVWRPEYMDSMSASKGAKATPLYADPPQRKPLTEEEIDSIWDSEKAFADIYAIARAIERAHGIGA